MSTIKIKRHTARAVGMLNTILNSKWKKEDRKIRMLAAISLAKNNIEQLEEEVNKIPDYQFIKTKNHDTTD